MDVPEWGGTVLIAAMTGAQRDAWEQSLVARGGQGAARINIDNVRARLVAYCAVDEDGKRLFSDGDASMLGEKSGAALERCARVAQRLNGLTEQAMEDARGN